MKVCNVSRYFANILSPIDVHVLIINCYGCAFITDVCCTMSVGGDLSICQVVYIPRPIMVLCAL